MIKRLPLAETALNIQPSSMVTKKKTAVHYKKKHIQNLKKLEKLRIKQLILERVNSWLQPDQCYLTIDSLKAHLRCLKELSDQNGYSFTEDLLFPTGKKDSTMIVNFPVIYADKFVKKFGLLETDEVFTLLAVSSLVATKFWQDAGIDFGFSSEFLGIPKKQLIRLERDFLIQLNYDLCLTEKDLVIFRNVAPTSAVC